MASSTESTSSVCAAENCASNYREAKTLKSQSNAASSTDRCSSARANWAQKQLGLPASQPWRSITPLTRTALPSAHDSLLLVGDAARVVEPFTGEGIFYAMRSGEIAAAMAVKLIREKSSRAAREYARLHAAIYRGRLWINVMARLAVVSPKIGSAFFEIAQFHP